MKEFGKMKIGITKSRSIADAFHNEADIRLYEIELRFDDGSRDIVQMYIDINSPIRNQICQAFNPMDKSSPQIATYRLSLLNSKSRR